MPNIRYVCLSDLHLGEEDSLLTNVDGDSGQIDRGSPSPVLVRLAACLTELLRHNDPAAPKPTLVLNGDLLELALGEMDAAVVVFSQLLSLLMPEGGELFGEIIFLAGNHDHHLWEIARETQYLNYMRRVERITELAPPWHTTKVFMDMQGRDRLVNRFLTAVVHRFPDLKERNLEILAAYPNFGLLEEGGRRSVIFHHGHFIEPLYHLMSTLMSLVFPDQKLPDNVYDLEAENFAWIDFFWSAMGRSGRVGSDVERIYEATNDEGSLQKLTDSLANSFSERYDLPPSWPAWIKRPAFKALLRRIVVKPVAGKQERQQTGPGKPPLTESAADGLRWYAEGPLQNQVKVEHGPMPQSVKFVFGHTHKPFQRMMDFAGYAESVGVLNTGGWIVDTVSQEPTIGGAVALIDEQLNAVNLRMYNEGDYMVHAEEPVAPGMPNSAFLDHLRRIVSNSREPWRSFNETVEREIIVREKSLRSRLSPSDPR